MVLDNLTNRMDKKMRYLRENVGVREKISKVLRRALFYDAANTSHFYVILIGNWCEGSFKKMFFWSLLRMLPKYCYFQTKL